MSDDFYPYEIPNRYRGMAEKAHQGDRKSAIRVHCLSCMGWSPKEVDDCTSSRCPLYRYRLDGLWDGRVKKEGRSPEALARIRPIPSATESSGQSDAEDSDAS